MVARRRRSRRSSSPIGCAWHAEWSRSIRARCRRARRRRLGLGEGWAWAIVRSVEPCRHECEVAAWQILLAIPLRHSRVLSVHWLHNEPYSRLDLGHIADDVRGLFQIAGGPHGTLRADGPAAYPVFEQHAVRRAGIGRAGYGGGGGLEHSTGVPPESQDVRPSVIEVELQMLADQYLQIPMSALEAGSFSAKLRRQE